LKTSYLKNDLWNTRDLNSQQPSQIPSQAAPAVSTNNFYATGGGHSSIGLAQTNE